MRRSFDSLVTDAVSNARSSRGWDFSYLEERRHTDEMPWNFDTIVITALDFTSSLLDMDTGGGERLRSLSERASHWPARVVATESFEPNLAIADQRLSPIGVEVVPDTRPDRLPFNDAEFELIINRHGRYSPREVRRILRPGGTFITEQVGHDMCIGLNRLLEAPAGNREPWDQETASAELSEGGLQVVDRQEHRGRDVFDDIGAVVWYLLKVPWQIPDFSVERYSERLRAVHQTILARGSVDAGSHHFLIVAQATR